MTQLPPLNALRAFDYAGQHLNFRIAADEMGVTQGAVAQQVRLLEAYLGIPLFERLPKSLAFTSAGRSYHARVSAAFGELRRATETLKPEPDSVLVSVTPTFASKWLIPNLSAFSEAHPDIDLRILATEKVSSFHSDGIDLAIRQTQPPFGGAIEADRIFRNEIVAVAAPQLVANYALPLVPKELASLPKLHDAHDHWPDFLSKLEIEDHSGRGLRLSQAALTIDAATTGQGIALVGKFLVERSLSDGHLVKVSSTTVTGKQDFYLLAERRRKRSKAVEAVRQWFLERADPAL
ncbi:MAG: LysR substrate-binding domain-containing protein [Pikeienuella sp.]